MDSRQICRLPHTVQTYYFDMYKHLHTYSFMFIKFKKFIKLHSAYLGECWHLKGHIHMHWVGGALVHRQTIEASSLMPGVQPNEAL